jgi:phage-related protein
MAIETFSWGIKASSQPTLGSKDTVRKAQFGDGYAQVSGSGLNDEMLTYEFSFSGDPQTANQIHAFFAGTKRSRLFSHRLSVIKRCGVLRLTASKSG